MVAQKVATEDELSAARAGLGTMKAPRSPTPLADRLHIPGWVLDLIRSALGSVAGNGLAAFLLSFGAHHRTRRVEVITPRPAKPIDRPVVVPVIEKPAPRKSAAARRNNRTGDIEEHAAKFAVECLTPGGEADLQTIRSRYGEWCPPARRRPDAQIGRALAELFNQAGIEIPEHDGRLVAMGVSLKQCEERELLPVETA
jgi:hypothetical protein